MEQQASENVIDKKKDSFKILGIGSSLNKKSTSTRILQMTLETSRKYGATVSLLNLQEFNLPIFNPNKPREITHDLIKINQEVNRSDAFILATPDYHGSMSGGMKNFLDYYWYEFSGK
ncbi:MAG: NAD(P)H-dependent oxidoreductase, partial [Nitrososphaeraceae archaeon]|nr:NAD(P)H-dependent oxidoreductase [Nitrososphaeraceae archaeon]